MSFCTSIHCMDGRIQEPTINYLKQTYGITHVDTITEPGPCKILAENKNKTLVDSILNRVNISINKHGSKLIAISGHYDCAGNPCGEEDQKEQTEQSVEYMKNQYPETEVIGLWIDDEWTTHKI
jgi:carbonic anhydrase